MCLRQTKGSLREGAPDGVGWRSLRNIKNNTKLIVYALSFLPLRGFLPPQGGLRGKQKPHGYAHFSLNRHTNCRGRRLDDPKTKEYRRRNGRFVNRPTDRRWNLLFCAKGEHLIHHYRGPPSPRGKALGENEDLTATHLDLFVQSF